MGVAEILQHGLGACRRKQMGKRVGEILAECVEVGAVPIEQAVHLHNRAAAAEEQAEQGGADAVADAAGGYAGGVDQISLVNLHRP